MATSAHFAAFSIVLNNDPADMAAICCRMLVLSSSSVLGLLIWTFDFKKEKNLDPLNLVNAVAIQNQKIDSSSNCVWWSAILLKHKVLHSIFTNNWHQKITYHMSNCWHRRVLDIVGDLWTLACACAILSSDLLGRILFGRFWLVSASQLKVLLQTNTLSVRERRTFYFIYVGDTLSCKNWLVL